MFLKGVVEDNKDPKELGRVKVRILGLHSEFNENSGDDNDVSTEQLPWAEVMGSTLGLVSGVGMSIVLKQGTWVRLYLEDDNPNKPIVVGTILSASNSSDNYFTYSDGTGFCDPDEKFPTRVDQSDISGVARGILDETVIRTKNENLVFTEEAQETSEYPLVDVFEAESGAMMEYDNTPGKERVQLIDKAGNYLEFKLGTIIEKAVNDRIMYITRDLKNYVLRDIMNLTHGNTDSTVKGNVVSLIEGNETNTLLGDLVDLVKGNVETTIEGNETNTLLGDLVDLVEGNINKTVLGDLLSRIEGNIITEVTKNMSESVGGSFTINADGNLEINNSVKINGELQVTGDIGSDSDVYDSEGTLRDVRTHGETHTHIGNLGGPTSISMEPMILGPGPKVNIIPFGTIPPIDPGDATPGDGSIYDFWGIDFVIEDYPFNNVTLIAGQELSFQTIGNVYEKDHGGQNPYDKPKIMGNVSVTSDFDPVIDSVDTLILYLTNRVMVNIEIRNTDEYFTPGSPDIVDKTITITVPTDSDYIYEEKYYIKILRDETIVP